MPEKNHYALIDKPSLQNLEANQRGRLTPEQKSALERAAKSQSSSFVFFGAIVLAFVGFIIFFFWQVTGEDGLLSSTSMITMGLVVFGVVLLILVLSGGDFLVVIPRDEIENGQVESVIGKVAWTGRRYQFVSDSRKLRSMRSGRALPPPGDYRLYCLPRSGLVILAEELGLSLVEQTKGLLLEALAGANHFSIQDLELNRQGSLSGRQGIRLFGYASLSGAFFLIFIGMSILAAQSQKENGKLMMYIFLVALIVVVFLLLGWGSIKDILDIWDGEVRSMDGQVLRQIRRGRNTRFYVYQLGELNFKVSRFAYNALMEGREYRVYLTPRNKRLVAIEPI